MHSCKFPGCVNVTCLLSSSGQIFWFACVVKNMSELELQEKRKKHENMNFVKGLLGSRILVTDDAQNVKC